MILKKIVTIILFILLIGSISATVYIIVNPNPDVKFTEFYILGAGDKAGYYPTNLRVNETGNIKIGIVNHEHSPTNYTMVISLNGTTITQQLTLANNETRMINHSFTPTNPGNQTIEFKLYKLPDTTNVYRSLLLHLNVV
jgi:uncharacterized membrane protein